MRLLRRNALGLYAVQAAAIVTGFVVTPVVIHSIGTQAFGVWSFIGSVTIYLAVLDFGVGPSIVRFGAEARGRQATEDLDEIASTGLFMYAVIGLITLPVGAALAWIVPWAAGAPAHLTWETRITTLLVVLGLALRFPLGLFNNLLIGHQRWDVLNLANFASTASYGICVALLMPRHGSLVLLGALTLGTTMVRLLMPLFWLRREFPQLRLSRSAVSRQRLRQLVGFGSSNFLVHISQKIVFSTDVIVVGIILGATATGVYAVPAKLFAVTFGLGTAATSLMFPAFAELEGAQATTRQRNLLLSGLRGGMALMLLLALPLLLIPDLLIRAWIHRSGFHDSYAVMSILAAVLLIHAPVFVLTQFLIARAQQRPAALIAIATTLANLALSFVLAYTVGLWGVALSTLVTDVVAFLWIAIAYAAPAATVSLRALLSAIARPVLPAAAVALAVLVGLARLWEPRTMPLLALLGAVWTIAGAFAIWRFGLSSAERSRFQREVRSVGPAGAAVDV